MTDPRVIAREPKLLGIYLNDHLMGANGGLGLARRILKSNAGTKFAGPLEELVEEIAEDRLALTTLMDDLQIPVNRLKAVAGVAGEKVGRLKLNGRILGYSPLSRLIELEGLIAGVNLKLRLWLALRHVAPSDGAVAGVDLERLVERAQTQLERLERLRLDAAEIAFRDPGAEPAGG